ncbi:MAG: hypothetical protein P4L57_04735 [Rhizomicrobium sp.]|nr:hypothetical protein [Rhizomicrobium sp.]
MFAIAKRGAARALASSTVLVCAMLLAGCEAVGIPPTGDPEVKLSQAELLMSGAGYLMQARRLTEQAITLFEQRGDKVGLARAYREYGLIALGGGMTDNPALVRDPNAPLEPSPEDLNRAEDALKRALDLAVETDQRYLAANIHFVLGNIAMLRGIPQRGCAHYSAALTGFRHAQTTLPGVKLELPAGAKDPVEFVERAAKEAGCKG